jgi:hypothetical protein
MSQLRCLACGSSAWDPKGYGCGRCGKAMGEREEGCYVSEETKKKLLNCADELSKFGIELEEHATLQKGFSETVTGVSLVLQIVESLRPGTLRDVVLFLRELAIPDDEILGLRLDEPEQILTYCGLEKLRHSFRPQPITALFVGESPPQGGTFFYKGNSLLYYSMKESFGGTADFLAEFKAKCFFVDDLVLYPVNKMEKKERNEHRHKAVASLARRMIDYRPAAVVVLMCAIENMVIHALSEASLSHVPRYVTPFPGPFQRERFNKEMAEIIPKLPTC